MVIGAGFCGLAAAYELGRRGIRATVLEQDSEVGGLAGSFEVNGVQIEKFYHHWFSHDWQITKLVEELGKSDRVLLRSTRTGMYYANNFFRLSTPLDLFRFSALPFGDRVRLGLLALRVGRIRDWRSLEDRTATDWLREMGGERVYRVVWEPLLRGKFGDAAEDVAAVWIWNKLKLRGGSRGRSGKEQLAYYRGGFAALVEELVDAISIQGGVVKKGAQVTQLQVDSHRVQAVDCIQGTVSADAVIATPALPIIADLVNPHLPGEYVERLRKIRYLANICVILELDCSLSDIYWLNVNDPSFPFVAVIEHTNFEPVSTYGNRHVVYLSKYLPEEDSVFRMPDDAMVEFTLKHLRKMFPDLESDRVLDAHVWRARYAQPIVERGYRKMIPDSRTGLENFFLATMAQVYPEDRGTNYAVQLGREVARMAAESLERGRLNKENIGS